MKHNAALVSDPTSPPLGFHRHKQVGDARPLIFVVLSDRRTLSRLIRAMRGGWRAANGELSVALTKKELAERKKAWKAPALKAKKGTLRKYIENVAPAYEGCVTDEFE